MRNSLSVFLVSIGVFFCFLEVSAAGAGNRIDMGVSPIVDEFPINKGQTLTRTVKFFNNSDTPYTLYISTEDCVPGTNYGTPQCRPYTGTGIDIEKASTWITPGITGNFTVPARSSKNISYTVKAPANASPGGHYGALFFNNPDSVTGTGNSVSMVRRIGMLFMITIPGATIVDTEFGDILVDTPGGSGNGAVSGTTPTTFWSAPLESIEDTLTRFMMTFTDPQERDRFLTELNPFWEKPELDAKDFNLTLKVPVKNEGNTHIKPTGKIYLYDENGEQLKQIGKVTLVDENGVYLGEKIVDYLPINDEGGNVLPGTERVFQIYWNGFAYNTMDANGSSIIGFESPSAHYTQLTEDAASFIYPWEKMALRKAEKILKAQVELSYTNPKTQTEEVKKLELPLAVNYLYIAKVFNWSGIILFLGILGLFRVILRRRDRRIQLLKNETHKLEDEITVLEKAQKSFATGKVKTRKNATPKKESAPKNVSAKKPTQQITTTPKKAPAKKTTPKIATPAAKKPVTKKKTKAE